MAKTSTITRDELYRLVWETPLTRLAARFGVSDVAVAKACRKRAIPHPGLGHWARVDAGQKVATPPLPKKDPGEGPIVFTSSRDSQDKARGLRERVIQAHHLEGLRIHAPERLGAAHSHTALTRSHLKGSVPDEHGLIYCRPPYGYDIAVSPAQLSRALRILDCLAKNLESRGASIELDKDSRRMQVVMNGVKLRFALREHYSQAKVAQSRRTGPLDSLLYPSHRYEYRPTGVLEIRIDAYSSTPIRRVWADGTQPLESRVGDVVIGFFVAAEAVHEQEAIWADQNKKWQEDNAHREAEARREAEGQRRLVKLVEEARMWGDVQMVHRYLRAIERALEGDGRPVPESARNWLEVSHDLATRANPLGTRLAKLFLGPDE